MAAYFLQSQHLLVLGHSYVLLGQSYQYQKRRASKLTIMELVMMTFNEMQYNIN